MNSAGVSEQHLGPREIAIYRSILENFRRSEIPFLVGGAFAFAWYTSIDRYTKDLDIFVRSPDCPRALAVFEAAGYRTELTFPHWLGKIFWEDHFVDVIFSSGNGVARVSDPWFDHAVDGEVLGIPVQMVAPEEMIWSKGFIMERERYDGADIAHLLRACGRDLDWDRLLDHYGTYWRVLLSHLVLFDFIYPADRSLVPQKVLERLAGLLISEHRKPSSDPLCRGTILSRGQYLSDIQRGFVDARLPPEGNMTPEEIAIWTAPLLADEDKA